MEKMHRRLPELPQLKRRSQPMKKEVERMEATSKPKKKTKNLHLALNCMSTESQTMTLSRSQSKNRSSYIWLKKEAKAFPTLGFQMT
jgi:hypothetical protein